MTVKELRDELNRYPDNMHIVINKTETEFSHVPLEKVTPEKIGFSEEPNGKVLAKDKVLVLSDEI